MKLPTIKPEWVLYGVAAGAGLLVLNALLSGRIATSAASTVARLPIDTFMGGAEGFLGLPDTRTADSISKCEAARLAGNDWEASFYCPAASWFRGLFDGK